MTDSHPLPSIELDLAEKLRDPVYRNKFFLAEGSARIARQLIALRKRRGLTQKELAVIAGMKQPAISRVESADYRNWSHTTLSRLAEALGGRYQSNIDAWEDVLWEYEPASKNHDEDEGTGQLGSLDLAETVNMPKMHENAEGGATANRKLQPNVSDAAANFYRAQSFNSSNTCTGTRHWTVKIGADNNGVNRCRDEPTRRTILGGTDKRPTIPTGRREIACREV